MTDGLNETILDKLARAVDYYPDDDDHTEFVDMEIIPPPILVTPEEVEGIGDS